MAVVEGEGPAVAAAVDAAGKIKKSLGGPTVTVRLLGKALPVPRLSRDASGEQNDDVSDSYVKGL